MDLPAQTACCHSGSLEMVPLESFGTVSTATMAISLPVLTQYTNVTDTHPDTTLQQKPCYAAIITTNKTKTIAV